LLRLEAGSEAGDTLLEVLISAMLLVLIVVATLNGLDSNNHATALSRARFEADALAQQSEDELRSEPAQQLSELNTTKTVSENGTNYTITTTGRYRSNATSSAETSCTSATTTNYIETRSEVSWAARGAAAPAVETAIVSPPPGTTVLVQVLDAGYGVSGVTAVATGPVPSAATHTLVTSNDGCAVFALTPGEYTVNAYRASYVTPNGFENTDQDPLYKASSTKYLVAESSSSYQVQLAPSGKIEVSYKSTGGGTTEGDSFVALNSLMSKYREFGTVGALKPTVTSEPLFPFPKEDKYTIYAGSCLEDAPEAVGSEKAVEVPEVIPGHTVESSVIQPPLKFKVMSGKKFGTVAEEGSAVTGASVRLEDTKCNAVRTYTTNTKGEFATTAPKDEPYAVPYGTYKMCVTGGTNGPVNKKYTTAEFENNTATGPSSLGSITDGGEHGGFAMIYMGASSGSPGTLASGSSCP
jgi:Tfp pilus assembly protein PilV